MRYPLDNPVFPTGMVIWLDDKRKMPYGYDLHIYGAESLIRLIRFGYVGALSFDNDLGTELEGQHVSAIIKELAHGGVIFPIRSRIHSLNASAAQCIMSDMKRANEYWGVDWDVPYEPDFR